MKELTVNTKSDIAKSLTPAIESLDSTQFHRAVGAASKRATAAASKVAREQIKEEYTVDKSAVSGNALKTRNEGGVWELYSKGQRLSSTMFGIEPKRGTDTTGLRRRPVMMHVDAGKPMSYVPRSWLWARHGGLHLARRKDGKTGKRGGKYIEIQGPAVAQMLSKEGIIEEVSDRMVEVFEERVRHEIEFRLSKMK